MNAYTRSKFSFLIVIVGMLFIAWFTEDILHLGLYDWFENVLGGYGVIGWGVFWLLVIFGAWQLVKKYIQQGSKYHSIRIEKDRYIETLLQKWSRIISSSGFPSSTLRSQSIDPIKTLFYTMLVPSAKLIDVNTTAITVSNLDQALEYLVQGSLAIGLEYKSSKPQSNITQSNIPEDALNKLFLAALPAYQIAAQLILISHQPGRVMAFGENQEMAKSEAQKGLIRAARNCFIEGANF